MPGSEYSQIPFADEIKALIDTLETTIGTLISSLETTVEGLETAIASLEADLEGYGFDYLFKQWDYILSDDILKSSDAEESNSEVEFIKVKEITFDPSPVLCINDVDLRIKWQLKITNDAFQADSRVYVNGGVISGFISTSSETYVQKSYDLGDINHGDKIQLYIRATGSVAYAKDFKICGKTNPIIYEEPIW